MADSTWGVIIQYIPVKPSPLSCKFYNSSSVFQEH